MECETCGLLEPSSLLQNCPNCMSLFHLTCIGLEPDAILYIQENLKNWNCPRCICCAKCEVYIYDSSNLQCAHCARAFHGFCRPKKSSLPVYPYTSWYCDKCEGFSSTITVKPVTILSSSKNVKKTSAKSLRSKENLLKNQKCLLKNENEIKVEENLLKCVNSSVSDNCLNTLLNLTPQRPINKIGKKKFYRNRALLKTEILEDSKSNNNSYVFFIFIYI